MSLPQLLQKRFAPFRNARYRAFFSAQFVSLIGNWMQELAKSWIIISLAGQAAAMGTLMFISAIPHPLFGLYGGVLADRRGIRDILIVTQIALAILAFSLGILAGSSTLKIWHLMVFAFLEGVILAFDMPAFSRITPLVVPREEFQQALALNSVSFHMSRVLGPSVAGIMMAFSGPQAVFWFNALSFTGVVIIIMRLPKAAYKITETKENSSQPQKQGIGEALRYLRHHPVLGRVILQFFVLMALVFPLVFTSLRILFQTRFHLDAQKYGLTFAVPGFGALLGSLTFLLWSPKNPLRALPVGVIGIFGTLIALAEVVDLNLAILCMAVFSFCMFLTISSINVTIQLSVENHMRGRVLALVGQAFVLVAPLMAAPLGFASDWMGERHLLWTIALLFGGISATLAIRNRTQA
jgi:MFS family permease